MAAALAAHAAVVQGPSGREAGAFSTSQRARARGQPKEQSGVALRRSAQAALEASSRPATAWWTEALLPLNGGETIKIYKRPVSGDTRSVFSISRDRSRSGIKPCNHKNQIWDKSRNKWYLSHSGCGIKSGIHTTFLARNCGFVSRRACTLGRARELAVARTPARRFCATRPCTLYFMGHVP